MERALVCAVFVACASAVGAAGAPEGGRVHALIVKGLAGSPLYERRFADWSRRFREYLASSARDSAGQVVALPQGPEPATLESTSAALERLAASASEDDQVVVVLIGHGLPVGERPRFVLEGPDLDAQTLARLLAPVRARNQVVLNMSASSGAFVRHLAKAGRVNVAANSPGEGNEPVFAEFFLRGLEGSRADGWAAPEAGAKDGVVTLLEAYNWAAWGTAQWISRQSRTESGEWRVDGRESVEVFERLCAGEETWLGVRRLSSASDRLSPDRPVPIMPEGYITEDWAFRRVLSERAVLEDCGRDSGASALVSWLPAAEGPGSPDRSGYRPLAGSALGEPGHLARRVVLGRASLLP